MSGDTYPPGPSAAGRPGTGARDGGAPAGARRGIGFSAPGLRRGGRRAASLLAAVVLVSGLAATAPAAQVGAAFPVTAGAVPAAAPLPVALAAWGAGADGQLGTGTTDSAPDPVPVAAGALAGRRVVQVAAGWGFACAVAADGLLACWGDNTDGQLGTGAGASSPVPVAVAGGALAGRRVEAVAAGAAHACALAEGSVYCWGDDRFGQLGDGATETSSAVPVAVSDRGALPRGRATGISAGGGHTCAVADGAAYCWGNDEVGQLGDGAGDDGAALDAPLPVAVHPGDALGGRRVAQVSAGFAHTCAVADDGALACWGFGAAGQLGTGEPVNVAAVPVLVADGTAAGRGVLAGRTVAQVSAGFAHTCAVARDGTAACWGMGDSGQLGDGAAATRTAPVAVAADGALARRRVAAVAAGRDHTCAVAADGALACWGSDADGQLGADADPAPCGTGPCARAPAAVAAGGGPGRGALDGAGVRAVAAGDALTVALTSAPPQPATPTPTQTPTPTRTPAPTRTPTPAPTRTPTPAPTRTPTPAPTRTPAPPPPGPVRTLAAASPAAGTAVVTWRAPSTGTTPTGYRYRVSRAGGGWWSWRALPALATRVVVARMARGTTYAVAVLAVGRGGAGPARQVRVAVLR